MALNKAKTAQQDAIGGVFLDDQTLDRLKTSADGPQFAAAWLSALAQQTEGMRQCLVVLSSAAK